MSDEKVTYTVLGCSMVPPGKGPAPIIPRHLIAGPFTQQHLAERAMVAAVEHGWCNVTLDEKIESAKPEPGLFADNTDPQVIGGMGPNVR